MARMPLPNKNNCLPVLLRVVDSKGYASHAAA